MTVLELEELDLERMKFNAFRVAEEVSERIDCSVAPDGFMKSFVTRPADKLFYWDKEYLTNYLERKNKIVPGYNYYSKLENFSKAHIRIGNKCLEFVKFACENDSVDGSLCLHCSKSGWIDCVCQRIPEPMPDYESTKYKYMHVRDTPNIVDGKPRTVDDFNPRVQLKKQYEQGTVKAEDPSTITTFAKKFIVNECAVKACLDDLIFKDATKVLRKKENRVKRQMEEKQSYEDIDWLGKVEDGTIKKLLVKTLDKYFAKHNMTGCLRLKKNAKIQAIAKHVRSQGLMEYAKLDNDEEIDEEESSDSESSDDGMDEVQQ